MSAPPDIAPQMRPGTWPPGFVRRDADREALLILSHVEGIEPRRMHALAKLRRTASLCLAAVRGGSIGSDVARATVASVDPDAVRARLETCAGRIVAPGDPEYVARLEDLVDPPAALFVRGRALSEVSDRPAAAIVGARRCSPYGREVAEDLGAELAAAGVAVVSGAALGVDAAAHRGALRAGGFTIAVLGSGIDEPYPRTNRALIDEIARRGSVVSEYPPGRPAVPRQFPARNRLIAALASVVVVVEGAADSGSLITAELGLDIGREIAAVPGQVTSELSRGPNDLIRDGAALVRSAGDVLEVLGIGSRASDTGEAAPSVPGLAPDERSLLRRLAGPSTVDAIASAAGIPVARALTLLAALELRGCVRAVGGRYEPVLSRSSQPSRPVGKGTRAGVAKGEP